MAKKRRLSLTPEMRALVRNAITLHQDEHGPESSKLIRQLLAHTKPGGALAAFRPRTGQTIYRGVRRRSMKSGVLSYSEKKAVAHKFAGGYTSFFGHPLEGDKPAILTRKIGPHDLALSVSKLKKAGLASEPYGAQHEVITHSAAVKKSWKTRKRKYGASGSKKKRSGPAKTTRRKGFTITTYKL